MSYFHAIILGLIQGLSEFLPISSSGHLVIIPYIFNWHYQGLDFDIALHFGTALAIIAFFWHDWVKIIANAIEFKSQNSNLKIKEENTIENSYPHNLFWIIIVASIPAAIAGYKLDKLAEHAFRNPLLIAVMLAVFGVILWLSDSNNSVIPAKAGINYSGSPTKSGMTKGFKNIGYTNGFVIGIAQAIALLPGVSRSGITTTAGLFMNFDRKTATRFSFLLATPALLGAFVFSLKDFSGGIIDFPFVLAIISSAISGYFAIKYLLLFIEKHGYGWFAVYRIAIAIIVALIYFIR